MRRHLGVQPERSELLVRNEVRKPARALDRKRGTQAIVCPECSQKIADAGYIKTYE